MPPKIKIITSIILSAFFFTVIFSLPIVFSQTPKVEKIVFIQEPNKELLTSSLTKVSDSELKPLEMATMPILPDYSTKTDKNEVVKAKSSEIEDKIFTTGKKKVKGFEILGWVRGNKNGNKLYQQAKEKYGKEVADVIGITLFYENGSFWEKTVGVCSKKHQIGGDYRNCNYADINTAGGMDVGLFQVNTWFQRAKIQSLAGFKCDLSKAESRERNNPCNARMVDWLQDVDNNIQVAFMIVDDGGLIRWIGCEKAFRGEVKKFCKKY